MPTSLFDALVRQQVYLEGLKAGQAIVLAKTMRSISADIVGRLRGLKYKQLDQMTKVELMSFVATLKKSQMKYYNVYTSDLLVFLQDFMKKDHKLIAAILLATANKKAGVVDGDNSWSSINNAVIPATGTMLVPFINYFVNKAVVQTVNTITKGYASKWSTDQTISQLVGGKKNVFNTIFNGGKAVSNTVIQFVAANANAQTAKTVFNKYQWVSILDNRTTEICLELEGQVFKTGDGPLPPMHIGCRSHAYYFENDDTPEFTNFDDWFKGQSNDFVKDILRKGQQTYADPKPLTLDQFVSKLDLMTGE